MSSTYYIGHLKYNNNKKTEMQIEKWAKDFNEQLTKEGIQMVSI